MEDPAGQNLAMPPSFPQGATSGFDADEVCLLYQPSGDTLYVGVKCFNDVNGIPIPFGDADGDGNPAETGKALADDGGTDQADLSNGEYFSFILDLDADVATDPDVVSGVSITRRAPAGYRVSEVALPHLGVDFSLLDSYYGNPVSSGGSLFASPDSNRPDLEFTIAGFSTLPGFSSVDVTNPDDVVTFIFKGGSISDTSIGDEDVRLTLALGQFFDGDEDGVPDASDKDRDNDGIPDVAERDLEPYDRDGSCELSASETGTIQPATVPTDTDGDGTPDYLDTDSDNDTILDIHEADTYQFDANGDLKISPDEFTGIDIGNYAGGDGNGCLYNSELPDSDGDGVPDYRDKDSDDDYRKDSEEAGDSDPMTSPVDSDGDKTPDYRDTDSDNDGMSDETEVGIGTNPTAPDVGGSVSPSGGGDTRVQIQGSGLGGCSLIRGYT